MPADRPSPVSRHDAPVAFLVGQDGEGHWLAVETHGLGGGLVRSRDTAVRYARHESQSLPGAVRVVEGPIRLFAS